MLPERLVKLIVANRKKRGTTAMLKHRHEASQQASAQDTSSTDSLSGLGTLAITIRCWTFNIASFSASMPAMKYYKGVVMRNR